MSHIYANSAPVTQKLATFVHNLRYADLSPAVKQQMTISLIDYFRVGCAGLDSNWVAKLRSALEMVGGVPMASVLYSEQRIDPVRAALLNGVIAGSLDWDDTHVGAMLHPGVVVWPAVMAVGELVGASGKAMIEAAAAGYETVIRVGLGVQPAHFRRGFQATSTCGVFGSAAASAKLLGLNEEGVRNALGLAASYAGGVTQFFLSGSEVKRLHAGKAAAAGVESALLAKSGLSGPHDALEGVQGFGRAMGNGLNPDVVLAGIGDDYKLLGLQFKPHAVSARVLAAIECAELLVAKGARAEEIETIEIGVPSVVVGRLTESEVHSLQQAQMSAPFAVALTLILAPERRGPLVLGIKEIETNVGSPRIDMLLQRTSCVVDAEIEAGLTEDYCPARVTIELTGGRRLEEMVMYPIGSTKRPMNFEEVAARFVAVVGPVAGKAKSELWLKIVQDLGSVDNVTDLLQLRVVK